MKKHILYLIGIFFLLSTLMILPVKTSAKTTALFGAGDSIYVGPDEVIENNFIRGGQTVEIKGKVNGDVIVGGVTVTINGTVAGDVIAAGNTVTIEGEVLGNVRVAGGSITINAKIGKNVNAFAQTLNVNDQSEIGWSLFYAAQTANIKGSIAGHLDGGGQINSVAAKVGGNAAIYANEENGKINIVSPALIKGNLTYQAKNAPTIEKGAEVKGDLISKPYTAHIKKDKLAAFFGMSNLFFLFIKLFSLLLLGLVIISLFKKHTEEIITKMKAEPLKSMGWGLIYLIVIPIVSFLLVLTIIGIPLALILIALYLIALYVSKVLVGVLIGWWIMLYFKKDKKDPKISLMLAMILGVVVFSILTYIPYLGWLIVLAGTIWAFGALVEIKKKTIQTNI